MRRRAVTALLALASLTASGCSMFGLASRRNHRGELVCPTLSAPTVDLALAAGLGVLAQRGLSNRPCDDGAAGDDSFGSDCEWGGVAAAASAAFLISSSAGYVAAVQCRRKRSREQAEAEAAALRVGESSTVDPPTPPVEDPGAAFYCSASLASTEVGVCVRTKERCATAREAFIVEGHVMGPCAASAIATHPAPAEPAP